MIYACCSTAVRVHVLICVGFWYTRLQTPQCIKQLSHTAQFCDRNVHTCAYFCYKVGHCGKWTAALWDLCKRSLICHIAFHMACVYLWFSVLIITEGVLEAVSILVTLNSKKPKAPISCFRKKWWCFRHFVLHEKPYLFFVSPSIGTRAPFQSCDRLISALGFTILVRSLYRDPASATWVECFEYVVID